MTSAADVMERTPAGSVKARPPVVCWFEECRKDSVPLVGGKCSSLGELINAGVRVPPGFALTTEGYRRFMAEAGIDREVAVAADRRRRTGHRCTGKNQRADPRGDRGPALLHRDRRPGRRVLPQAGAALLYAGGPGGRAFERDAEDLPGASFAGQQDTYLWIRGVDDLLHHMRRCISSLFTGRAIAYRANKGFGADQVAISVGVQKMANSYTAGVMFTIHPANGDRSVIVIDSNFGFGESVVSGEVTPDHFVVNKITLDIIDRTISQKQICYTVDPKTQTSQAFEVPFERQKVQSLIDDEITELAWMGKQIEKHYGRPMDIEWAVDKDLPSGGNIFILQARPETVWSEKSQRPGASPGGSAMDYILSSLLTGKKVS